MILDFEVRTNKGFRFYDLVLAVLLEEMDLAKEILTCNATVELGGRFTRGKVVIDFFNKIHSGNNQYFNEVNFIKSIHPEEFWKRMHSFFLP